LEHFDLCVIGGGPSGYAAAMRAVDFKKKVVLIEKDVIGGAGITNGALSSKTWWELSRQAYVLRRSLKQFNIQDPVFNFLELEDEVKRAIEKRKLLLNEHMTIINSLDGDQLVYKQGNAFLLSPNEIKITSGLEVEKISADYIVLATGSRPRKLPHIPIDEKVIITSDGIDGLRDFPESMVILGAGVIGCEFTTIFSGFGRTQVNLIDKGDRILPFEDSDIVNVIETTMEDKGVTIHRNSQLTSMQVVDGRVEYELEYTDGRKEKYNVEKALVSVGRVPNYENLGLEDIGVKMDERGIIDDNTQTSVSNIYAVGDITADIALVNVGELEARYAVERIFGKPERDLIYENISTIMFLDPEVAGVGLNEIQAKEKGLSFKVAMVSYDCVPRAITNRDTRGFIKMIVSNDSENKILGMRVVGQGASASIQAVALLISMNKGIEELAECVHPHPSITEGIQECVRLLLGKSLFKPSAFTRRLTCKVHENGSYKDLHF
jgi:dihydrolipoamide dehydrogenase